MLITKVLGNIKDFETTNKHIEKIFLKSDDLVKRIIRVQSDHNNDFGFNLEKGHYLQNGDIVHHDEHRIVVIVVKNDEVLVISPKTFFDIAFIAHDLGNRHCPIQIQNETIIIPYDHVIEQNLIKAKIDYQHKNLKLEKPFKYAEHHH